MIQNKAEVQVVVFRSLDIMYLDFVLGKCGFYSEGIDAVLFSQTDESYYFPELKFLNC